MVSSARLWSAALVLGLALAPTSGVAQAVTGAGADAIQLSRGTMRIGITGLWDDWDRVHTASGTRPLLAHLSTNSLGVRALPQLVEAEQAIRALSGNSAFTLSLGTLEATGDARQSITPISFEYGVSSRLSIGLVVPYVESRDNEQLILNRDGTSATVGQNPAYSSTAGATARSTNGLLLRQLEQARTALAAEIARCAEAAATNCDAVRANPAAAQQLVQQALDAQSAIATVYGDSVRGGAPVVPIASSGTQMAVDAFIGTLRTGFAGFGVTAIGENTKPASATIINGPGATTRIVNDSAYGLDYEVLGNVRRAGIGDVDLSASFLWLNTLGQRPAQWLDASRFGVRSQLTAGWRFGTAGADRTNTAFDIPIGSGANALLARSSTDLLLTRSFWLSGTVRVVQPMADQAVLRRPVFIDSLLFVPSTVGRATRTLGRRLDMEIAPRIVVGRFFGLSGGYLYRRVDASTYAFDATDAEAAVTQTVAARTMSAYMVGVTFSTLASYVRNRSRWPVEVLYVHTEPISATGDAVPAVVSDRLELRIYTGFPRR